MPFMSRLASFATGYPWSTSMW